MFLFVRQWKLTKSVLSDHIVIKLKAVYSYSCNLQICIKKIFISLYGQITSSGIHILLPLVQLSLGPYVGLWRGIRIIVLLIS